MTIRAKDAAVAASDHHQLASLGDLMELMVEGWRVDGLHYADRSAGHGSSGPPAAFFHLRRGAGEDLAVYIPDDGRAFSHRALVGLFRERPEVWKHRSTDAIAWEAPPEGAENEAAGGEIEPPESLTLGPGSLRQVLAVNQIQSIEGLTIALIALERHDSGARLRYMAHASNARTRRQMRVLDVAAVDDTGFRYRVASTDARAEGNRLEGCLVLAPAVARERTRLTVAVGTVAAREPGVGVGEGDDGAVRGPWVFPIPLGARPTPGPRP